MLDTRYWIRDTRYRETAILFYKVIMVKLHGLYKVV